MKKYTLILLFVIFILLFLPFIEAKEVSLDVGNSCIVNHKSVTLDNVGSGGAIVITVDGTTKTISRGSTDTIEGITITNHETYYEDSKYQRSAIIYVTFTEVDAFCSNGKIDSETEEEGVDCGGPYCSISICPTCEDGISCNEGNDPIDLAINSPINEKIYDKKNVPLFIETDKEVSIYYLDNTKEIKKIRKLCSSCEKYFQKILSVNEGFNNITIMAIDEDKNEVNKTINFYVDSKKPIIKKTYPKQNSYANGEFTVEYVEENIKEINLYIDGEKVQTRTDCPSSNKKTSCKFDIQLNSYLGQEKLKYSFEIVDITDKSTFSRGFNVKLNFDKCNWRPTKDYGSCDMVLGLYYNGYRCVSLSGCDTNGDLIPFDSEDKCVLLCE